MPAAEEGLAGNGGAAFLRVVTRESCPAVTGFWGGGGSALGGLMPLEEGEASIAGGEEG